MKNNTKTGHNPNIQLGGVDKGSMYYPVNHANIHPPTMFMHGFYNSMVRAYVQAQVNGLIKNWD